MRWTMCGHIVAAISMAAALSSAGEAAPAEDQVVVDNGQLRIIAERKDGGYGVLRFLVRVGQRWQPMAVWQPLMRIIYGGQHNDVDWQPPLRFAIAQKNGLQLYDSLQDPDGGEWQVRLTIALVPDEPLAKIRCEWRCNKDQQVRALWGPNLLVGENGAKLWGLLPGVEFLYDGEPSSNTRDFAPPLHDRRTPNPKKVTIPLMAITIGGETIAPPRDADKFFCPDSLSDLRKLSREPSQLPPVTVALLWNPSQRWDGERGLPSFRFESPSAEGKGHRLGLFIPSCPDFVPENSDRATKPYHLRAGQALTLEFQIAVEFGHILTAVKRWLKEVGGLPKPNPTPRDFEQQLALDRFGFLHTVWDEQTQRWRHCVDWAPNHAPGFATLLWFNGHAAKDETGKKQALERVHHVAELMLKDGGAGSFISTANCHIMRWEFPFHYGYLPEAISALDKFARNLIAGQQPDGGWRFEPADEKRATLGRKGDAVLGTMAHNAAMLLRYARITGDVEALKAGEKTLLLMEQFRVPRGGQTWECPMYEPDILPAAWAVAAYLEAFWATGNPRWLHDAVYWAETGVPFVYLWQLPERPMMLGATIPVFGSTFYTHSWLGMPVQWCGLVYAYQIQRLAKTLERHRPEANGSPLPLSLDFTPRDWKRLAELIAISAQYQQFDEGKLKGTYPDSITDFIHRNPAFINPEDIAVNVLALNGFDPDIKTVQVAVGKQRLVVSSGADTVSTRSAQERLSLTLRYFAGELSHTLIANAAEPKSIACDGRPLPRSHEPLQRQAGWWWDGKTQRLFIAAPHQRMAVSLDVEW
jgi:hypothetical protein